MCAEARGRGVHRAWVSIEIPGTNELQTSIGIRVVLPIPEELKTSENENGWWDVRRVMCRPGKLSPVCEVSSCSTLGRKLTYNCDITLS